MTQIDFYIMSGGLKEDLTKLVCRLTEKAVAKSSVYIHCENEQQAADIDAALWSFKPESFIPHQLQTQKDNDEAVIIGYIEPPEQFHEVIINLTPQVPKLFARFQRLLELVPAQHDARAASRDKYKLYKDRGYPLNTHKINL